MHQLAAIVGVEPDVVEVPDDGLADLTAPIFGHLFGVRHHAMLSIDKANAPARLRAGYDFRSRPRADLRVVP